MLFCAWRICLLSCLQDTWRCVTVDDRIPVDLFGRALLVGSRPLQLWPLLLCKAILKVMAVYRTLDMTLPHQVRACTGETCQVVQLLCCAVRVRCRGDCVGTGKPAQPAAGLHVSLFNAAG